MPIYEYVATDGTKIELIRSMKDADAPVQDPEGKGRTFKRICSTFASSGEGSSKQATGGHVHSGGCGCGKPRGSCGMNN
jgi:predicted nucleic acid-binding Zn ribbon protein